MTTKESLHEQICRFGLWSAVIALVTTIITFLLPLDVPSGYSALPSDRVAWLMENRQLFILGWINQIAAMLSLSGVFLAIAWCISEVNPLRACIAATVVLLSVVAFIIPKFIAVWTIPLLAEAIANDATGGAMAAQLLPLLNVSIPFSLYTSFDYLGFWLYAVFGLLVAMPLYQTSNQASLSTKITASIFGAFGLLYHVALIAMLVGSIAAKDIELWFISVAGLVLIAVIAALPIFKGSNRLNADISG